MKEEEEEERKKKKKKKKGPNQFQQKRSYEYYRNITRLSLGCQNRMNAVLSDKSIGRQHKEQHFWNELQARRALSYIEFGFQRLSSGSNVYGVASMIMVVCPLETFHRTSICNNFSR